MTFSIIWPFRDALMCPLWLFSPSLVFLIWVLEVDYISFFVRSAALVIGFRSNGMISESENQKFKSNESARLQNIRFNEISESVNEAAFVLAFGLPL